MFLPHGFTTGVHTETPRRSSCNHKTLVHAESRSSTVLRLAESVIDVFTGVHVRPPCVQIQREWVLRSFAVHHGIVFSPRFVLLPGENIRVIIVRTHTHTHTAFLSVLRYRRESERLFSVSLKFPGRRSPIPQECLRTARTTDDLNRFLPADRPLPWHC